MFTLTQSLSRLSKRVLAIGLASWAVCAGAATARAGFADLKTNYSEASNPNVASYGTWRYNMGTTLLSPISSWAGLPNEKGWGPAANVSGNYIPFLFQAHNLNDLTPGNNNGVGNYAGAYQVGDIIFHSKDSFNGSANGEANITWTSPGNDVVNITGSLWPTRSPFTRENKYQLILNPSGSNTLLASGFLPEDGTVTRANPSTFSVPSFTIHSGDTLELLIVRAGLTADPAGDFAGVNFTIASVPEPASLGLLGSGVVCLLLRRARKSAA